MRPPGVPGPLRDRGQTPGTTGRRIAHLRVARGWTQYELAAEVGCRRQEVTRWESDTWMPGTDALMRISAVFGVDPRDIWVARRPV